MPVGVADGGILEPGDQSVGYSSELTIQELSTGISIGRRLILKGPALPFMGATWAMTNQIVTTWYPGNGTAGTQQVLGPRESPSSWEGEWNRTRMGRLPSIYYDESGARFDVVRPDVLRDVVESMARGGALLRVTWAVKGSEQIGGSSTRSETAGGVNRVVQGSKTTRPIDSKIVREGRIKSCSFPHDRHTDIRWTIEFEWVSRGGTQKKIANVDHGNDLSTAANSTIDSANRLNQSVSSKIRNSLAGLRGSSTRFTLGQLESIAKGPTTLVDNLTRQLTANISDIKRVGDVVAVAALVVGQPASVANSLTSFARTTTAITNNFIRQMGRVPSELQSSKDGVSDMARAYTYVGDIQQDSVELARQSQALDASLRKATVSAANRGAITVRESATTRTADIIKLYIAKAGDTPTTVSQKFYQSPDHGVDILRVNRMPWHTPSFRPGQIIVIPVLNNATRNYRAV